MYAYLCKWSLVHWVLDYKLKLGILKLLLGTSIWFSIYLLLLQIRNSNKRPIDLEGYISTIASKLTCQRVSCLYFKLHFEVLALIYKTPLTFTPLLLLNVSKTILMKSEGGQGSKEYLYYLHLSSGGQTLYSFDNKISAALNLL